MRNAMITRRQRTQHAHGRYRPAAVAAAVPVVMGLSACSAGQITQTQPEFGDEVGIGQDSAAQGITKRMGNDAITLSNVQLLLATDAALDRLNPYHLVFDAANANPATDFRLERIEIDGKPVAIGGGSALLCSGSSIATPTARQIADADTAGVPAAGVTVQPVNDTCSAPAGTALESLSRIHIDPITLPGKPRPGTSVDATFQFQGMAPMTFPVPVTVPVYWDRSDAR
ncbi:hypothetical protein [Tomitella fengzijianii]|uniref:Uncharacterized protein n=1 Tax=Tomitella fengzijianii TaxID=2597660 RepID=A0A516X5D9_9ACTN|nr:hypothetical protein [Tomitella fengzijianii]QDQ98292.1 hypothetical protein FO059_14460 [Tomitella fengzijianii]